MLYEYRTLPLSLVIQATAALPNHPDAYLSDDAESRALPELLAQGFRWIRTDGEVAVFERSK